MSSDRNYCAFQVLLAHWQLSLVKCQRNQIEKLRLELELRADQIAELYAELRFYRDMLEDFEGLELVDLVSETQPQP